MYRSAMYRTGISCFAAALFVSPLAAADRVPTPEERGAIEKVLRDSGFVSWEEIELDDDRPRRQPYWDVDDARDAQGQVFDLKIEPGTLKVLRRTPDRD